MTEKSKKAIKKINSTIRVPKEETFKAIETGIYLGKKDVNKYKRKKYIIGLVALAALAVIIVQHSIIVDAVTEVVVELGAKLTKVKPEDPQETAPKKASYNHKVIVYPESEELETTVTDFDGIKFIKPITLETNTKITKELLMKYHWAPLAADDKDELALDVVQSSFSVRTFNKDQVNVSMFNTDTGAQVELDDDLITYSIKGNKYEEKIILESGTELEGKYELSIVDGLLVMFPNDEYDHKKEREILFQAIELKAEDE